MSVQQSQFQQYGGTWGIFFCKSTIWWYWCDCTFQSISYWAVQRCDCSPADLTGHCWGDHLPQTGLQTGKAPYLNTPWRLTLHCLYLKMFFCLCKQVSFPIKIELCTWSQHLYFPLYTFPATAVHRCGQGECTAILWGSAGSRWP